MERPPDHEFEITFPPTTGNHAHFFKYIGGR